MVNLPSMAGAPVVRALVRRSLLLLLSLLSAGNAHAALTIIGTRFIYPAGTVAQTIRVGNAGDRPVLLQAWLDRGDAAADPSAVTVPFLLTPPVVRIDPQGSVALQLRHTGEAMPADRESVFWINFLEVPPRPAKDENMLKLALRQRMKVLYRPAGLAGSAAQAIAQLRWRRLPGTADGAPALEARNDSPYFVSLADVTLPQPPRPDGADGAAAPLELGGLTVPPFGSARLALPAGAKRMSAAQSLHYQAAGDAGEAIFGEAGIEQEAQLRSAPPAP